MILIRKLSKKDRSSLEKVYTETVKSEFPEYSKKVLDNFATKKYRTRVLSLPTQLGAFEKGRLVGYLLAEKPAGGVVYIAWLAVIKEQQKKGIGTKLLEKFEKISRQAGVHNIQFDTNERNIGYYKSRGYELVGLDKKGYYGVDHYILKKLIQEPKEENYLK